MTVSSDHRVWTCGEALAALVAPGVEPAEHANGVVVGVGGAELNVAIGLARLGHPVTWCGVVGDDPWGRRICRELRGEGVTVNARITRGSFTGAYLRERRASSLVRATYLRRGSAGSLLEEPDVEGLRPVAGDIVHLTGITPAISESAHGAWLSLASRAHQVGALVSLDTNYRTALCTAEDAARHFAVVAPYVGLVMASIEEAAVVSGAPGQVERTPAQAAELLAPTLSSSAEIIIKDGPRGSLHRAADGTQTSASALDVQVADVIGAGDAFTAGYLSGVLDGEPVPARLQRGHMCAAFVVATDGDWQGAPRREELSLARGLSMSEVQR